MVAEFDCCECGAHTFSFGVERPPEPRLCCMCQFPGWFNVPELRDMLDPTFEVDRQEREP